MRGRILVVVLLLFKPMLGLFAGWLHANRTARRVVASIADLFDWAWFATIALFRFLLGS